MRLEKPTDDRINTFDGWWVVAEIERNIISGVIILDRSLKVEPPSFAGLIGVARRDITPPVGIYARCWGAAEHDVAQSVHRELNLTVLAMRCSDQSPPLLLVAMDGPWLQDRDHGWRIRKHTLDALGLDESHLIVNLSHSHAAASLSASHKDKPGGDLIEPYVEQIVTALLDASREAIASARPAVLSFAETTCPMVGNRDLPDPDNTERIVCGWNPNEQADQTVMVGRVTDDEHGRVLATLVNFACHPTTLAWENQSLSPDYVGAMREVVESHTGDAPCLFLQGASGELAPKEQYTGDVEVADRHGRCLGYSVLSAIESLPPHRCALTYQGVVESGAPLAVWKSEPFDPCTKLTAKKFDITLPLRPQSKTAENDPDSAASGTQRWQQERASRAKLVAEKLGHDTTASMPAWIWRIGRILFVGQPNEAYSDFQQELRRHFPNDAVIVMNLCNNELGVGYLCPPLAYDGKELYQAWQSPFDRQALPHLINCCIQEAESIMEYKES